jgi:hypothetical protein
MWMFLFLLLIQANSNPCPPSPAQTQSPSLIVQVVDPVELPVPGAEVTLKLLPAGAKSKSNRIETDKDGYARFSTPGDADYSIEAKLYGFKRERLKRVHVLKSSGSSAPAYVRLQLRLSESGTMVY